MYYKYSMYDIHHLQECIKLEVRIGEKLCNFLTVYCSQRQSQNKYEKFCENLQHILDFFAPKNPFSTILINNSNTKSSK